MSNAPPPPSSASSSNSGLYASSTSAQQQRTASVHSHHQTAASSIYSFSVHQPYTNWPLHASSSHYPGSWYPVHAQPYGQTKTYKDNQVQTANEEEESETRTGGGKLEEKQPYRPHWDGLLRSFLKNAGLHQALRGLKEDMLMMNTEWEQDIVPGALKEFVKDLTELLDEGTSKTQTSETLEERKLDYIKPATGAEPQTPTSFTRSIARFLAQSRLRNDLSNRGEFLQSIAEKRRRLNPEDRSTQSISEPNDSNVNEDTTSISVPSCARADAKAQDRDVQMKYDIAKNEDGPLKRTIKLKIEEPGTHSPANLKGKGREVLGDSDREATAERHPGLAERLSVVETHLAVRYVPSPPQSLIDRLRFLEDHIVKLEKDYPPWAALHFHQPNRGWPPPPRITPIIVPSHLTSSADPVLPSTVAPNTIATTSTSRKANSKSQLDSPFTCVPFKPSKPTGKGRGKASSLHRAVMEKLEVQRAMGELAESKAKYSQQTVPGEGSTNPYQSGGASTSTGVGHGAG